MTRFFLSGFLIGVIFWSFSISWVYDAINFYGAGYGNTTSAVDAIQFKFASGNIDSGTIKLYGVKDS